MNGVLIHATTWMTPVSIMLNNTSQTEVIYCMTPFIDMSNMHTNIQPPERVQLRGSALVPICGVGMYAEFFNIIFCLTKPSSSPKCPSSLALRKLPHGVLTLLLPQPGPAWPLLPSTRGPSTLKGQREVGDVSVWGDYLCSVSNKKYNLTFLYKSKKKTQKTQTF